MVSLKNDRKMLIHNFVMVCIGLVVSVNLGCVSQVKTSLHLPDAGNMKIWHPWLRHCLQDVETFIHKNAVSNHQVLLYFSILKVMEDNTNLIILPIFSPSPY